MRGHYEFQVRDVLKKSREMEGKLNIIVSSNAASGEVLTHIYRVVLSSQVSTNSPKVIPASRAHPAQIDVKSVTLVLHVHRRPQQSDDAGFVVE